jgi:hypothetical protein
MKVLFIVLKFIYIFNTIKLFVLNIILINIKLT